MHIKQDRVSGLWCREDGAILVPPCASIHRFTFEWSFGIPNGNGYRKITCGGKVHLVHRLVCRAYHGLPPKDKGEVDHIDRNRENNAAMNLRWVSRKENCDNMQKVEEACAKYGIRECEDKSAYHKAYNIMHAKRGV